MARRDGAAAEDKGPVRLEFPACRPPVVFPAGDRGVVRVVPGQHDFPGARCSGEPRRLGRYGERGCGRLIGCRAVSAGVYGTDFEGVSGSVGQLGDGVGGRGRSAAVNIGPVAVIACCLVAVLPAGDVAVAGVGPAQRDLPVASGCGEACRLGRYGERGCGFLVRCRAVSAGVYRAEPEGVSGSVGELGDGVT